MRHDILIQCHGNYVEMKRFNNLLEIDMFTVVSVVKSTFEE